MYFRLFCIFTYFNIYFCIFCTFFVLVLLYFIGWISLYFLWHPLTTQLNTLCESLMFFCFLVFWFCICVLYFVFFILKSFSCAAARWQLKSFGGSFQGWILHPCLWYLHRLGIKQNFAWFVNVHLCTNLCLSNASNCGTWLEFFLLKFFRCVYITKSHLSNTEGGDQNFKFQI